MKRVLQYWLLIVCLSIAIWECAKDLRMFRRPHGQSSIFLRRFVGCRNIAITRFTSTRANKRRTLVQTPDCIQLSAVGREIGT